MDIPKSLKSKCFGLKLINGSKYFRRIDVVFHDVSTDGLVIEYSLS